MARSVKYKPTRVSHESADPTTVQECPVLVESGDPVEPGPPHQSSVLGYTLYSLGFDPQEDGAVLLDTRRESILRIVSGERPTPVGMMHDLEDIVDDFQRPMAALTVPAPLLCSARQWMAHPRRFSVMVEADEPFLVHQDPERRFEVMEGFSPVLDAIAEESGAEGWPRDSASMWGACCRLVAWSPADAASALGCTLNLARRYADGLNLPTRDDWKALMRRYDQLVSDDGSPVGVGIRWARAKVSPVLDEDRSDLERHYSDAGDGVTLFEDREDEQ